MWHSSKIGHMVATIIYIYMFHDAIDVMVLFGHIAWIIICMLYVAKICKEAETSSLQSSPSRKRAQPKKCDTTDIQRKVSCQTGPSISPKMTSLVVTLRSFEGFNFDRSAYVGQPRTRQSRSINASQCGSWDDVIRDGKERLGVMRNGHLQEVVCLILSEGLFWVNYNDLTTTSLEIMVSKGNHPQMALIQVSEIL